MKKFIYLIIAVFFTVSISSCGAGASIKKDTNEQVISYTLKSKKELMKSRILSNKSKIAITLP